MLPHLGARHVRRVLQRAHVVAVQAEFERAKFETGFSRWVKGQAQGLQPGGFKPWVNWIQLAQPHHVHFFQKLLRGLEPRVGHVAVQRVLRGHPARVDQRHAACAHVGGGEGGGWGGWGECEVRGSEREGK